MTTITAYVNYNGTCEEAFNFYASIFTGSSLNFDRFSSMPNADQMPESDQNKIMHAALTLGNQGLIMGSDVVQGMSGEVVFGNNFGLTLQPDSEAEAIRLFNALSAGGTVTMPLEKTFWNATFGMFVDKFGINWMVNYDHAQA
ncbi:MAG: VOC family protein [Ardenticatenaceae bacterium]|nr:VOC family protein [Anaerolineales bacterium]MCB8979212.1 VOC family protein [Ardenticatenaceae bacterium]